MKAISPKYIKSSSFWESIAYSQEKGLALQKTYTRLVNIQTKSVGGSYSFLDFEPDEELYVLGRYYLQNEVVYVNDAETWRKFTAKSNFHATTDAHDPIQDTSHTYWTDNGTDSPSATAEAVWRSTKEYDVDDIVYYMPEYGTRDEGIWKQYKCIASGTSDPPTDPGNIGQAPPEYDANTYWVESISETGEELGATNEYKMIDYYVNTEAKFESVDGVKLTFLCNNITALAFICCVADNISIKAWNLTSFSTTSKSYLHKDNTEYYDYQAVDSNNVYVVDTSFTLYKQTTTYKEYFFSPFEMVSNISTPTIAQFPYLVVEVEFVPDDTKTIKIGHLVAGDSNYIGSLQLGVSTGIQDYSRKETDDAFGRTYLKQGNYKDTLDGDLLVYNEFKNSINSILRSLRAKPTVFEGNEDDTQYNDLLFYGFLSDFSVIHESANHSIINIEGESLI